MSTTMIFVIKKENQFTTFDVTSGGLRNLYNPKIFEGDVSSIDFFMKQAYPEEILTEKPNKDKMATYGYFIIMDFDTKKMYDYQPARNIRCFSGSIDMSWQYWSEWFNSKQLINGLVNSDNCKIMVPFPEEKFNLFKFLEDNQTRLPLDKDGDLILRNDHISYSVAIDPKGWSFNTIDLDKSVDVALSHIKEYWQ